MLKELNRYDYAEKRQKFGESKNSIETITFKYHIANGEFSASGQKKTSTGRPNPRNGGVLNCPFCRDFGSPEDQ